LLLHLIGPGTGTDGAANSSIYNWCRKYAINCRFLTVFQKRLNTRILMTDRSIS